MMESDFTNEKFCLFFLKSIRGLKEHLLADYLKNGFLPKNILHNPPQEFRTLIQAAKINRDFLAKIRTEFLDYQGALSILDPEYPKLLKTIFDPPLFLFYQGNLELLQSQYLLTIVGSRTLTQYHQNTLINIIHNLHSSPMIIVSGLALGIDSLSHQKALENNLGTIAVLGSGFAENVLYPHQNLLLAKKIVQANGLILSEYPPQTRPNLYQFPKRNRILAGLSKATIVISGAKKSGTLITAQCALENGREVFALPGNTNLLLAQGPNDLIYQGANILLDTSDILKSYDLNIQNIKIKLDLNSEQKKIYTALKNESLNFFSLQNKLQMPTAEINKILSQLELNDLISLNQFNQWEIKC